MVQFLIEFKKLLKKHNVEMKVDEKNNAMLVILENEEYVFDKNLIN